jgi:DNA-binding transcriptional regulator YiaG
MAFRMEFAELRTVGEIRAEISRQGFNQGDVARLIGVDPRTVRRWLSGDLQMPESARRLLVVLALPEVRKRLAIRVMRTKEDTE